jgi:tripartite-type tricarboxylate transporter receptor subunit TctC
MKTSLWFLAAVLSFSLSAAHAQTGKWPEKPVRVVLPFPPGGANDIVARLVLPKLTEQMGQPFVIENRTGAGGSIGTAVVAQSKPDGYTLLIQTTASHVSNAHLYKNLPYDALGDFAGISPLARLVGVLTVHPSLPARSVKEIIALAKKRPKEILFGHAGYGSFVHLSAVILESATGMRVTEVPYKGGGPAVVGLVSGETHAMVAGIGDIIEHIKAKRVRPLGVTSADRISQLPDVPVIADTVPGFESETWVSLFGPAGIPRAIIDQLNTELGKVLRDPGVASKLSSVTYDPVYKTQEELAQRLRADYDKIGKIFRQFNVRLD